MNAITATSSNRHALEPQNLQEAMHFAEVIAKSDMVPPAFKGKPANVLLAVQWGREVNLGPLQALQNIAVINGRPSIWGDAALALVQSHPAYEAHEEWVEGEGEQRAGCCKVIRRGHAPHIQRFSMADARKAGLLGKQGPWTQYTDRMLVLRARGFAVRDKFSDALRGMITAEEAQDIPAGPPMPPARGPQIDHGAAPPAETWPAINPAAKLVEARSGAQWRTWCLAFIGRLESPEAVIRWREAMEQNLEAAAARDAGLAQEIRDAIEARLDALADAAEREATAEEAES